MKSRDSLIKLRRFEVDEKKQKVADIEVMIAEFKRMLEDLDRQILIEQERAGVSDINHYAYPTFAKAAVQRKENLCSSIADLETSLEAAKDELSYSFEELKKVEMLEERVISEERILKEKNEQKQLDEFSRKSHLTF